jgi:two-component system alkaline phosphatase synthesis response regulator PhoP
MLQTSKRILIIDDDVNTLEIIRKILEKKKYCISTSTNGAEALAFLSKEKYEPDLVLVDILMPTLCGYDVMRLLKDKLTKKVKIAYVSIVPKQEADLRGVDGFIQKPFSVGGLLKQVKVLIKK